MAQDLEQGTNLDPSTTYRGKALGTHPLSSTRHRATPDDIASSALRACTDEREDATNAGQDIFSGDDGQALLLVCSAGKRENRTAILVPVYRPSESWAKRMDTFERQRKTLMLHRPRR